MVPVRPGTKKRKTINQLFRDKDNECLENNIICQTKIIEKWRRQVEIYSRIVEVIFILNR